MIESWNMAEMTKLVTKNQPKLNFSMYKPRMTTQKSLWWKRKIPNETRRNKRQIIYLWNRTPFLGSYYCKLVLISRSIVAPLRRYNKTTNNKIQPISITVWRATMIILPHNWTLDCHSSVDIFTIITRYLLRTSGLS